MPYRHGDVISPAPSPWAALHIACRNTWPIPEKDLSAKGTLCNNLWTWSTDSTVRSLHDHRRLTTASQTSHMPRSEHRGAMSFSPKPPSTETHCQQRSTTLLKDDLVGMSLLAMLGPQEQFVPYNPILLVIRDLETPVY